MLVEASKTPPAPSPSPTALPTLPPEEVRRILTELFRDGVACRLPCLWGVTPGITLHEQVRAIISPLAAYVAGPRSLDVFYPGETALIVVGVIFSPAENGKAIEIINLDALAITPPDDPAIDAFGDKEYADLLKPYMLPGLLSTYGIPSQIAVSTEIRKGEAPPLALFRLWILYPQLGSIIRYESRAEIFPDRLESCPSESFVHGWFMPLGRNDIFMQTLNRVTDETSPWDGLTPTSPRFKTLEEATGISIESFYASMIAQDDPCLATPLSRWPPP